MTSDTLQSALELNRANLKALLTALEADYEMADDPVKSAEMAALFDPSPEAAEKDVEMSDEEIVAWMFEENAKAIAAAAEAADARDVQSPELGDSNPLDDVAMALR